MIPRPLHDGSEAPESPDQELATLGGGCFWCLEAVFQELRGVHRVEPGYAGGHHPNPTYREVCQGGTGHAEVVRVAFDPGTLSYRRLLEVFFTAHDPTTPNRQGPDVGPQYRSIILHDSPAQEETARSVMAQVDRALGPELSVVTELAPLEAFHPAEEEHHDFYRRNQGLPYCRIMIEPKLARLREAFPAVAQARHRAGDGSGARSPERPGGE